MSGTEHFGYTEPLRRFIQRESFEPQANEIPNTAPSWLPGDDYYTNFKVGDPFIKVDQGYARLPGAGYEALHPELKGLDPEDWHKKPRATAPGNRRHPEPYSYSSPRLAAAWLISATGTWLVCQCGQLANSVDQAWYHAWYIGTKLGITLLPCREMLLIGSQA